MVKRLTNFGTHFFGIFIFIILWPKCHFYHFHIFFAVCCVIGYAALLIMEEAFGVDWPSKNVRAIFVGDDISDEDVMKVVLLSLCHWKDCSFVIDEIRFFLTMLIFLLLSVASCWQGDIIPCNTKSISVFICKFQITVS